MTRITHLFRHGSVSALAAAGLLASASLAQTDWQPATRGKQDGQRAAPIGAVAFSPDGRWLAVGGYREVSLVALTGAGSRRASAVWRLGGAAGPVNGVSFSSDGRLLAAAGGAPGQSGEIGLWDVRSRRHVRTLRAHRDALYGVAFSPDGRTLVAGSYDNRVSLWSVAGGGPRILKDHIDAVYAVAFSPDGRRVASASGDRTVKVWDVATGSRLFTLSEPAAEQLTLSFSPDGTLLAAAGADRMLRVWKVTASGGTLARSAFAHEGSILRLLFTPDGKELVTTGDDRQVKIWNVATLSERRVLERQPDWAPAITLGPDGARLAVGRLDGSLMIYNTATGERLGSLLGSRTVLTHPLHRNPAPPRAGSVGTGHGFVARHSLPPNRQRGMDGKGLPARARRTRAERGGRQPQP